MDLQNLSVLPQYQAPYIYIPLLVVVQAGMGVSTNQGPQE